MRVPSWLWNTGPALDPHQGPGGDMGIAQPVHMCFVDLEKAFDHVPWGVLWGALQGHRVVMGRATLVHQLCAESSRGKPGIGAFIALRRNHVTDTGAV